MSQGANAFSAALAAFILLLILGTEILAWYWLALIPLAAAGVGIYLALRRVPSPYRTAQLVDHRAELADTLSTALYFSSEHAAISSDVKRWQQQRAEEAARRVDLPRIFPYLMPRSAYIVGALALVASSLFGLRYGLSKRLDLSPALAHIIHDQFTPADKKEVAENRRHAPPGKDDADTSDSASQDQSQQGQDQQNADDPADQGDAQSGEKNGDSKEQPGKPKSGEQNQDGQGQNQQAEDQNQQQDSNQQSSGSQGDSKGDAKQQADGKQQSQSGESGSLLSKMKDFAENLLSKMKPQQQQDKSNSPQQSANQNSKQGQGQQQKGQQQKSQDGQQGSSDQADAQQGQNGDEKDGQQSQGKGSGDKSPQQNKQPGSGVGSEDGDKAIKRAEQLAAMGKITELVGKRSATVTGESTVEVQNTSQQLHTAYVQRGAQHQQTGTQIDRDEIPVALQPYVEQYFDQVRKTPGAVTPVAPVAPKKQ